jgi:hypothetical protein
MRMILCALLLSGTALASPLPPANKVDAGTSTKPSNQVITASEWNMLVNAVAGLQGGVPTYLVTTSYTGSGYIQCQTGSGSSTVCPASLSASGPITFTAVPTAGYLFSGWGGDCLNAAGRTCALIADHALNVTATFAVNTATYNLTVTPYPAGMGTVTCNGTPCTGGAMPYAAGSIATLIATAATGAYFNSWETSGALTVSGVVGTAYVTMNQDTTVTARFIPYSYAINTSMIPTSGGGTVTCNDGTGAVACGTRTWVYGSSITVAQSPQGGYTFGGWACTTSGSGSCASCTGTGTCTVSAVAPYSIVATFNLNSGTTPTLVSGYPKCGATNGTGTVTVTLGSSSGAVLLVATDQNDGGSPPTAPTDSGFSKSTAWSRKALAGTRAAVYTAVTSGALAGTETVTLTPGSTYMAGICVYAFTGYNATTPTGQTAAFNGDSGGGSPQVSIASAATSIVVVNGIDGHGNPTLTPLSGTSFDYSNFTTEYVSQFAGRAAGGTSPVGSGTSDTAAVCATAIEVVGSSGGGTNYNLTWATSGTGSGSLTCNGSACSASPISYGSGTVVTVAAVPGGSSTFTGWSGDCSGTGSCQVTMSAARSITATFNASGGGGSYPANVAMSSYPEPAMAEPPLGGPAVTFSGGNVLTNVLQFSTTRIHYAKTPVWNSDQTLIAVGIDGDPNNAILNASTLATIYTQNGFCGSGHHTWANSDRRYIYSATNSARQWNRYDATANTCTVLKTYTSSDFGGITPTTVSYGDDDGNTDDADGHAALILNDNIPFVINPKTGAVICRATTGGGIGSGASIVDSTITHDGLHMSVNWGNPYASVDSFNANTCAFERKMTSNNAHNDVCVLSDGTTQVLVQSDGPLVATKFSDGTSYNVLSGQNGYRHHVSCRNTQRPGWAYISTYNDLCDGTLTGMAAFHRIFALALDGSQTVEQFAWDHTACPTAYSDATMAVPSPDGKKVAWKAAWNSAAMGGANSPIHSYMAGMSVP